MRNQKKTVVYGNNMPGGGVYILRIATVLLAVVSWWATAQGMANYVFAKEWQAYLASLAIQAILLGLNFYFPTFWRHSTSAPSRWGLGILSVVVLFCSSWFSYVYIVERAYEDAWDTESRLLVQSAYRAELYAAQDYTEIYGDILRDSLSEQVSALYSQAKGIENNDSQIIDTLNLPEDRVNYVDNSEFAAQQIMETAILIMENAIREDTSANDREEAIRQISELQTQVNNQITSLEQQIERTESAITNASESVRLAQERLNAAPNGSDTAALTSAYQSANQNFDNQTATLLKQEQELSDYRTAQSILQQYAAYFNFTSGEVGIMVSATLRSIQSDLLSQEVDTDDIEEQAIQIFEKLQASEDMINADEIEYLNILNSVDSLIRDVQKYAMVKEADEKLDELNYELQNDVDGMEDNWKTIWTEKLNYLKAVLSNLPSYSGSSERRLNRYDRADSMDELDDTLRLYISDHNAAAQALIYLRSPYRWLALFSLMLAFFLDIAAFITGLIINIVERRQVRGKLKNEFVTLSFDEEQDIESNNGDVVIAPATARHYIFLTGDFTKEGSKYFFQVLDAGEEVEIELPNSNFKSGFYLEANEQFSTVAPQELSLYRMPDGPRDGIYQNCRLQYTDNILSIETKPEGNYRYLATVDENVPVYQMRKKECICQDIQDIPPQIWDTVIFALNSKGTQVEAIFLM